MGTETLNQLTSMGKERMQQHWYERCLFTHAQASIMEHACVCQQINSVLYK